MDLEKLAEKHLNEKLNDLGVGIPKYKHLAINLMVRYANEVLRLNGSSNKKCCDNQVLESGIEKYPLGLPLDRIKITYCSNCHAIHNIEW